jgi:hypothetical protein
VKVCCTPIHRELEISLATFRTGSGTFFYPRFVTCNLLQHREVRNKYQNEIIICFLESSK